MNKAQIKAELRRSACCDDDPWDCDSLVFLEALEWRANGEHLAEKNKNFVRTFLLLVAEAI